MLLNARCLETCGFCDKCEDVYSTNRCRRLKKQEKCDWDDVKFFCLKTCEYCDDESTTNSPTTTPAPTPASTTTTAPPPPSPTSTASNPTPAPPTSTSPPAPPSNGYRPAWNDVVKGDQTDDSNQAHVHEGLRLQDGSGWVGVGHSFGFGATSSKQVFMKDLYTILRQEILK